MRRLRCLDYGSTRVSDARICRVRQATRTLIVLRVTRIQYGSARVVAPIVISVRRLGARLVTVWSARSHRAPLLVGLRFLGCPSGASKCRY